MGYMPAGIGRSPSTAAPYGALRANRSKKGAVLGGFSAPRSRGLFEATGVRRGPGGDHHGRMAYEMARRIDLLGGGAAPGLDSPRGDTVGRSSSAKMGPVERLRSHTSRSRRHVAGRRVGQLSGQDDRLPFQPLLSMGSTPVSCYLAVISLSNDVIIRRQSE